MTSVGDLHRVAGAGSALIFFGPASSISLFSVDMLPIEGKS